VLTGNFYRQYGKWWHSHRQLFSDHFGKHETGKDYELKTAEVIEKGGEVKKTMFCPKCFLHFDPDATPVKPKLDIKKIAMPLPSYKPPEMAG
jgi:hypothetical protein